ncbi:MAG: hypothetical protein ABIA67_03945 [Candidatus Margulisiibacteriota bacterium]
MWFVLLIGVANLVCGVIMLFSPKTMISVSKLFDRRIPLDQWLLTSFRGWAGIVLVFLAAWMISFLLFYPELRLFFLLACAVFLFFGIIFIFFPKFLNWLSHLLNRVVFSTDQFVMGACRACGTIFVIIGILLILFAWFIITS